MSHAIVIATLGRAPVLDGTVRGLLALVPPPDEILLACVHDTDVLPETAALDRVRVVPGPKGSTVQRNTGIDATRPGTRLVSFFDDDVALRADALGEAAAFFEARPDVVAMTGAVLADGVTTGGIDRASAEAVVAADLAAHPVPPRTFEDGESLYGCNMHVRRDALDHVRFDERLPAYAWMEDVDFSGRLQALGRVGRFSGSRVVHLGTPSGRSPGRRLGYSQVINPLYLWRSSGSIGARRALSMPVKLTVRNALGSLREDPLVDRRGRLEGNLRGLADALRGRLDPERALDQ